MPIQVYQKKNTLLPALEMFAKYLAPIAEQSQLATLSKGQSDIYKNVKDPIELAQVHSQYIEQLNSNSDISAQNKHQLLQNANIYVGLKEGQLKEFKRVQTANTIADFMTGEVSKKKLVWKGQLVQGDVVAKELQQLSNGDPEVYAKMVEQAAQSGTVKYDTGIGYDDKGNIVGTSGYTDKEGNPFETQTGIIREYQTKNGRVLYTDKNNNFDSKTGSGYDKGEELNSRDAAEYGKMQKYEQNRQQDIKDANRRYNLSESNANKRFAAQSTKEGNFALTDGTTDYLEMTKDPLTGKRTFKNLQGEEIPIEKIDFKGMAKTTRRNPYEDMAFKEQLTPSNIRASLDIASNSDSPGNKTFGNDKHVNIIQDILKKYDSQKVGGRIDAYSINTYVDVANQLDIAYKNKELSEEGKAFYKNVLDILDKTGEDVSKYKMYNDLSGSQPQQGDKVESYEDWYKRTHK